MELNKARVMRIIKAALKEDIGKGDATTNSLVPKLASIKACITVNEECVICGINITEWVLAGLDYSVRFKPQVSDGDIAAKGKEVAFIEGHARAVLTAERTMLNFLSFLSGIATRTKKYVDKVKAYNVKILDTRKTFPLLRYLEKYAVSVGGGYNHRMNLGEMVMVKDNHIAVHSPSLDFARDRQSIVHSLRSKAQKNIKIEIEVQSLEQFEDTLKQMPDIIMLDNMSTEDIKKAVRIRNESEKALRDTVLEVSGGITLDNVEDYAKTGIDTISIGAITDSVRSIDFSLNVL